MAKILYFVESLEANFSAQNDFYLELIEQASLTGNEIVVLSQYTRNSIYSFRSKNISVFQAFNNYGFLSVAKNLNFVMQMNPQVLHLFQFSNERASITAARFFTLINALRNFRRTKCIFHLSSEVPKGIECQMFTNTFDQIIVSSEKQQQQLQNFGASTLLMNPLLKNSSSQNTEIHEDSTKYIVAAGDLANYDVRKKLPALDQFLVENKNFHLHLITRKDHGSKLSRLSRNESWHSMNLLPRISIEPNPTSDRAQNWVKNSICNVFLAEPQHFELKALFQVARSRSSATWIEHQVHLGPFYQRLFMAVYGPRAEVQLENQFHWDSLSNLLNRSYQL